LDLTDGISSSSESSVPYLTSFQISSSHAAGIGLNHSLKKVASQRSNKAGSSEEQNLGHRDFAVLNGSELRVTTAQERGDSSISRQRDWRARYRLRTPVFPATISAP
jgi:hypothetical protein